jgi:putative pyruvate formate lyase activating enzyme
MPPSHLELHRRGELARRAAELHERLGACDLCPRCCGVNRLEGELGVCGIGARARVASASPHFGEENPLVGRGGSGTIFFSGCNLRCAFCQNDDISMAPVGTPVEAEDLARIMLQLQAMGCHNINVVTPTHVVPMVVAALDRADGAGLRLPLVYNTGGYDDLEVIRRLDGVVDVHMPDLKFADSAAADRFCGAPDYPEVNREVVREMHRQVGDLVLDEDGVAVRGLLVRHLVMPNGLAGTVAVTRFLASELSPDTYVNLMDQYRPCHHAHHHPDIDRRVTAAEMEAAHRAAAAAGLRRLDQRRGRRLVL